MKMKMKITLIRFYLKREKKKRKEIVTQPADQ